MLTPDGSVISACGVQITIPPGAVPDGSKCNLQGDSVVLCPYLCELVDDDEQLVTSSILFAPIDVNGSDEFDKKITIKVNIFNEITKYINMFEWKAI